MTRGTLRSWGRYPPSPQQAHTVAWRDCVPAAWRVACETEGSTLAFGNGRSYGDSCLAASGHVIHTLALNRIIAVDWDKGVLRAETGTTLEQILNIAIPRGWMLPVTPGTKYATLGGAIANDVHGKNHHVRGTFGLHVTRFSLLRSDGSQFECTPNEHPDYYSATIGGLGLTGFIQWAEIKLMPIRTSLINVTSIRFNCLNQFFDLSEQLDPIHEYSVAWVDCHARGTATGRGVLFVGDHAQTGPLEVSRRRKRTVPFTPPVPIFNRATLGIFNEFYYQRQAEGTQCVTVDYDRYFYPLDSLLEWNRLYGSEGLQQYQCVVPTDAARDAISAILVAIAHSRTGSFLAVLKRCGNIASPGMLSFPLEGTSLALDFPQRDTQNARLFAELDAIVFAAGGRIYPAKDAHMAGADFRAAYPLWEHVEALRDPALLSRFWKRTTQI